VPLIKLEPIHIERADHFARRRQAAAIERNRQPHNGAPVEPIAAMSIQVLGVRCEIAGKLYLNPVTWNAFSARIHNLPDLEDWIDVKGRSKRRHDLMVQIGAPPNWAYLLVRAHNHPVYEISNWCWGYEARTVPISDPSGESGKRSGPAHFIPANHPVMKPPEELFAEVRRRQALDKKYG
jgi:hypothetical protein